MNTTSVTIETTLCPADRALLQRVEANQLKLLQLLTSGDPAKNWLTTGQACKRLSCSDNTLRSWRKKGLVIFDEARKRYLEESIIQRAKDLHLKAA